MALFVARHAWLVAAVLVVLSTHAHAQVCKETSTNGNNSSGSSSGGSSSNDVYYVNCDMEYKDTEVMCDLNTTNPSCPPEPMPMRDTVRKSPIKDYTPNLYSYARDPEDKTKPYTGTYYRGTPGDATRTFQLFGPPSKNTKQPASCKPQLKFPSAATSLDEEARMVRLELDNCTNQYILNSALYPFQKENTYLQSGEDDSDWSKRINLKSHCQPLKTILTATNEYNASDYLKAAWIKLLQDPSHRKPSTNGAPQAKTEPHLPDGVKIENPLPLPSPFPSVTLSAIARVQYEEINDPSHPFSPRWDYGYNERDHYSPMTVVYQDPVQNAVFCAGVRDAEAQEQDKNAEDQVVKVDVLSFRWPAFNTGIMNRIRFNNFCYLDQTSYTGCWYNVPLTSTCYDVLKWPDIYDSCGIFVAKPCWKCFGLSGKVDGKNTTPPCATHYTGKDLKISESGEGGPRFPGLFNGYNRTATCSDNRVRNSKYNIDTICRDLRAPYEPINKLKMRYHNPAKEDTVVLKDGVIEGGTHKEFFGNRMPYPRLWDTGRSLQRNSRADQDPMDVHGQYTAIVGIGHEATPGKDNDTSAGTSRKDKADKLKKQDQRCLLSGWGSDVSMGGVSQKLPDPIASWTEMKLYQTRTLRDSGLSCLGRYEKVFKPGSADNMILSITGAEYQRGIYTIPQGNGKYKYETLTEAKKSNLDTSANAAYLNLKSEAWVLGWRGYLSAKKKEQRFPNFPGKDGEGKFLSGLNNALPGDVIVMPNGANTGGSRPGLPKLAMVIEVNVPGSSDCETRKNCYVRVLESDNGKWPDICGTTDTWGEQKTRYLYKTGMLPENAKEEYERIKTYSMAVTDCSDTHLSFCELAAWDSIKIYRIREDKRNGNDGTEKPSTSTSKK